MRRFLLLLLAAVFGVTIGLIARAVTNAVTNHEEKPIEKITEKVQENKSQRNEGFSGDYSGNSSGSNGECSPVGVGQSPYPTGYVLRGKRVTVQMSDGTTRTERDKELQIIERNSVTIAGVKHYLRKRSDVPPAEQAKF